MGLADRDRSPVDTRDHVRAGDVHPDAASRDAVRRDGPSAASGSDARHETPPPPPPAAGDRYEDPGPAYDRGPEHRDEAYDRDRHVDGDHARTRAIEEPVTVPVRRSGAAVAALILGLIALVISIVPILGLIGSALGIVAIILGIVGLKRARQPATEGAGMAIGGIVAGVLSLVLGAVGIALFGEAVNELEGPANDLVEDVQTEIEQQTS